MMPTQPKLSPTEITSPGLIDLSASRMMPLTRLDTIFCKPKPRPTPTAPEKNASAERSMPTVESTIRIAKVISSRRINLPISTWIDGVKSALLRTRRSRKSLAAFAAHNVSISSTEVLITKSGVTRKPPITNAERIERRHGRLQQAEDAERRDGPGRHRHQPVDELIADQPGDQRDHHPGGGEADGDAEQIKPTRDGQRDDRRLHEKHDQHENDGAEIGQDEPRHRLQEQRPAQRQRGEVDAAADQRGGHRADDCGQQDQAELAHQPERAEFVPD